ncbi:MAG TPA: alpha-amylase family glycosyl hydrolase [Dermatophilaceae bacterium]|nr:alpha-amylase family glycosyl hydrolase [Dermatophilaceae bacterium]
MPEWVTYAVWWQVFPLGFTGAEKTAVTGRGVASGDFAPPRHRLPRIVNWLDYAIDLGSNGLLLGPVFDSQTHGYDTIDHLRVDPRLGTEADLVELIDAAHDRGIKVLLDGVFNHVGRAHPAFRELTELGPEAPRAEWFRLSWPSDWAPGREPDYIDFEGHRDLVALNHDHAEVAEYVARVMTYWLDRGADGWRLDAAYAIDPAFWSRVVPVVRAAHPHAYLVGETIHGGYADLVRASGLDSLTQYELWKAVWSSLNDANFFELDWALSRHNALLDTFVPMTFVGNHDVTRIASRIKDRRHLAHALVLLFTTAGTPCVYYGDEQGLRGVKEERFGGDDAIRPEFPERPRPLDPAGADRLRLHRELIGLRRRHPWLHSARSTTRHLTNTAYAYQIGGPDGGHEGSLVVALNLAGTPVRMKEMAHGALLLGAASGQPGVIELPPHGWAIFSR